MKAVRLAALLLVMWVEVGWAGPASQGYVPGGSDESIDFDQARRCEGGSVPGKTCATDPDCTGGGTCVTAWRQVTITGIGSDHIRRVEQRTMTGSAIAAFSSAAAPCTKIRLKAWDTNTDPVYVGYSGVSASTGWRLLPGEAIDMAAGADGDCLAVFVIGTTSDKVSVVAP